MNKRADKAYLNFFPCILYVDYIKSRDQFTF